MAANPSIEAEVLDTARRELLRAERSALLGLRRDGIISDDVYEELTARRRGARRRPRRRSADGGSRRRGRQL